MPEKSSHESEKENFEIEEAQQPRKGLELPVIGQQEEGGEVAVSFRPEEERRKENEKRPLGKIALATTNQMDTGVRAVSGVLRDAGFEAVKMSLYEDKLHNTPYGEYSEEELDAIVQKLKDEKVEALSLSVFEYGSVRAFTLAKKVKEELGIPVIMGGQHALQFPEECWDAGADAVCLGEGESGLVDLLTHWDKRLEYDNPNFIVKKEDLKKSKIDLLRSRLLSEEEISKLHPDFTYMNYFVLRDGQLVDLNPSNVVNLEHHQIGREAKTFIYASDRGCPWNCTFCYINQNRKLFKEADLAKGLEPEKLHRRKSIDGIIKDLVEMKKNNPQVEFLNIMNDDTAARSLGELQKFAERYKEEVDLPFYCMVSPQSLAKGGTAREKIQALIDAGMKEINMGIQTNEETSREIYRRPQKESLTMEVANALHEFAREDLDVEERGKIDLFFDFIINNPMETPEDTKRTIELIKKLPTPYDLVAHTLFISKRSELRDTYEQAKAEAKTRGEKLPVVLEDMEGEEKKQTDFHDTHRFYDELAENYTFVINTAIEFMAGRHDAKMTGRIPRYAEDLLLFDVFKDLVSKHQSLRELIMKQEITSDTLSIDLLTSSDVNDYFTEHKDVFKEFFFAMHEKHPIVYSNYSKQNRGLGRE